MCFARRPSVLRSLSWLFSVPPYRFPGQVPGQWSVAGLSAWRPGFCPIAVHVQFFVDTGTGFSPGTPGIWLFRQFQWLRRRRCGSAPTRLLGLRVRIAPEVLDGCRECCVCLRWADQSFRGVLPSVVSLSVIV